MRCLKLYAPIQNAVKAKVFKISYKMVAKEGLTNENYLWIYHFSEIRTFKMHVLISFSNLDPSRHQTDLLT